MIKKFNNHLAVAATLAGLSAITSFIPSKGIAEKPADVAIVSSVPLTVGGTVSAQQSGAWNVGLVGTPTFNLSTANGPVPVRNVDNAARHAYGLAIEGFTPVLTARRVPAGKRFIVQQLSADLFVPVGTPVVSLLFQVVQDGRLDIYPSLTPPGNGASPSRPFDEYMANSPVQVFLDSDSIAVLRLRSQGGDVSGSVVIDATLSGYLVDCSPSAPCEKNPF